MRGRRVRVGSARQHRSQNFRKPDSYVGWSSWSSVNGSASTTVGNYFQSAFGPFQLNVNGGLNVEKCLGLFSALPDRDGRVQARKFCLNLVSNIPDCITAWPGSPDLSAYVAKAGDTMTGTLNVAPGAVANGIVSTGAQQGVWHGGELWRLMEVDKSQNGVGDVRVPG